ADGAVARVPAAWRFRRQSRKPEQRLRSAAGRVERDSGQRSERAAKFTAESPLRSVGPRCTRPRFNRPERNGAGDQWSEHVGTRSHRADNIAVAIISIRERRTTWQSDPAAETYGAC